MSFITHELAQTSPEEIALIDERQTLNRKELDAILNRATNALIALNLPSGARVGVFARNSVECVLGYQAALHAGISSVPINSHLTAEELAYILEDSGTAVLFVGPETVQTGLEAAAKVGVKIVIGWRCPETEGIQDWRAWLESASAESPAEDVLAKPHLHYTSGTTGRPKGTETPSPMFSRELTVRSYFEKLNVGNPKMPNLSPVMVVSPLYHTGPLSTARLLAVGIKVVVLSRFDAENVLAQIDRHKIQSSMMVPTHFQRFLALPEDVRQKYDVSSVKLITHTGSSCPRDIKQKMIEWFGPVLVEGYGATESGVTNLITSEEWLKKPGSVGKTVPPFEVVVVSEDGKELEAHEVGELYFRDTTGRGLIYHNDAEKTKAVHREPAVFTLGEMGYFDEDGYVFITDRVSDMIVSGGVNIYPAEIEDILSQHPGVKDSAIIGAPNIDMGEEVKALVILHDGPQAPDQQELDRFCREHLAGYKCPRSYEFVADLGRNAMGKLNKRELRKPYWPTDRTIGG